MHTTNLRKVGESTMLALPPAILETLHLQAGATVSLAVEGERLVVQPQSRPQSMPQSMPRYSLEELLSQCDSESPIESHDREWIELGAAGREL
jgi:antitoxin ChpS